MKQTRTSSSLSDVYEREHFVQFYQDNDRLLQDLTSFIGSGLQEGDPCIVIATAQHRTELNQLLVARGIDVSQAKKTKQLVLLDAQATLNKFMVGGLPNKERFHEVVGGTLADIKLKDKTIRAFGEMVALLWAQDNQAGAILLEQLWNSLARDHMFTLFCAYPLHYFEHHGHTNMLQNISHLHSSAIMPEVASSAAL
jgi:hypothetical protein